VRLLYEHSFKVDQTDSTRFRLNCLHSSANKQHQRRCLGLCMMPQQQAFSEDGATNGWCSEIYKFRAASAFRDSIDRNVEHLPVHLEEYNTRNKYLQHLYRHILYIAVYDRERRKSFISVILYMSGQEHWRRFWL